MKIISRIKSIRIVLVEIVAKKFSKSGHESTLQMMLILVPPKFKSTVNWWLLLFLFDVILFFLHGFSPRLKKNSTSAKMRMLPMNLRNLQFHVPNFQIQILIYRVGPCHWIWYSCLFSIHCLLVLWLPRRAWHPPPKFPKDQGSQLRSIWK